LGENPQPVSHCETPINDTFDLSAKILISEIEQAIDGLTNSKSAGLDQIVREILKYGKRILLPYLFKLFNAIFDKGL